MENSKDTNQDGLGSNTKQTPEKAGTKEKTGDNFCEKSPTKKHEDAGTMFIAMCKHCGFTDDFYAC